MTFMFLIIILGATDARAPSGFAPIAIGLGLTLIHLISIPVTNTSVNPARSTGPALFVGGWAISQLWAFWVAPLAGRGLCRHRLSHGERRAQPVGRDRRAGSRQQHSEVAGLSAGARRARPGAAPLPLRMFGRPHTEGSMQSLVALLLAHGVLIIFLVTLAARVGAPVPASPLLVVAGSLALTGQISIAPRWLRRSSRTSSATASGSLPGGASAIAS